MLHRALPHRSEPHRAVPHSFEPHRSEPQSAAPHRPEPHSSEPHSSEPHSAPLTCGAVAVLINGAEILCKLTVLQLQRPPWAQRGAEALWGEGVGGAERDPPLPHRSAPPICPIDLRPPLPLSVWGRRSQTYRSRAPRRPPGPCRSCEAGPREPGPRDLSPTHPGPIDLSPTHPGPVSLSPIDQGPIDPGPIDLSPRDQGPIDLRAGEPGPAP